MADNLLINQGALILKGQGLSLLKPQFFVIDTSKVANESNSINGVDSFDKKSLFGTPVYDIVRFDAFSFVDENGITVNNAIFDLDVAIIEVSRPRNIVRTVIAGKDGTVKEFMSNSDYIISIKGMFVNPLAFSPPEEFIRNFNTLTSAPMSLKVQSNFLNYFGIYTIVIDSDPKIRQREGARNIVDYELECISDTPFEIKTQDEIRNNTTQSNSFF